MYTRTCACERTHTCTCMHMFMHVCSHRSRFVVEPSRFFLLRSWVASCRLTRASLWSMHAHARMQAYGPCTHARTHARTGHQEGDCAARRWLEVSMPLSHMRAPNVHSVSTRTHARTHACVHAHTHAQLRRVQAALWQHTRDWLRIDPRCMRIDMCVDITGFASIHDACVHVCACT